MPSLSPEESKSLTKKPFAWCASEEDTVRPTVRNLVRTAAIGTARGAITRRFARLSRLLPLQPRPDRYRVPFLPEAHTRCFRLVRRQPGSCCRPLQ